MFYKSSGSPASSAHISIGRTITLIIILVVCGKSFATSSDNILSSRLHEVLTERHQAGLLYNDIIGVFEEGISSFDGKLGSIPRTNVGDLFKCLADVQELINGFKNRELWTLKMLDSFFKPGPAILRGNLNWAGNYDECLDSGTPANWKRQFTGHYCSVIVGQTNGSLLPPTVYSGAFAGLRMGVCLPTACSSKEAMLVLDTALQMFNITKDLGFEAKAATCMDNNLALDTKAKASICVLGFIILLLIFGTSYDIYLVYNPTKCCNEEDPLIENSKKQPHELPPERRGIVRRIILSYSLYTNGKKILSTQQNHVSLRAVNGIRFLSLSWIILGQVYLLAVPVTANILTLTDWVRRWSFQAVVNASFAVDSFFALSGLLVTYLTLLELNHHNGRINWVKFYFHRWWRLTPAYALFMLFYVPLFPYLATGPFWPQEGVEENKCSDTWWTNLLYVNNFVHIDRRCMDWTWYLAIDMQFYIISPVIILPLYFLPKVGYLVLSFFLIGTATAAGVMTKLKDLPSNALGAALDPDSGFDSYYIKPWGRMGPYLMGMITGYILYKTECRVKLNKWVNMIIWCVTAAIALAGVYGLLGAARGDVDLTSSDRAAYNALSRTGWGIAVCWLVISCETRNGGVVNKVLSWEGWIPLSRLTYVAYLVHPVVINFYYLSMQTQFYMADIQMVYTYIGLLVMSFLVAFVIFLAFESPMLSLERVFLQRPKRLPVYAANGLVKKTTTHM